MRFFEQQTITEGYQELVFELLSNPEMIDQSTGSKTKRNISSWDVTLKIREPKPELNLWTVGFQPARWTKFLTEYTTKESIRSFFTDIAGMSNQQEKMYICPTKARHNHGNCLIGFTVHLGNKPRVHMYSRSTMLTPVGMLDISLGACIAHHVGWITGKTVPLVWTMSQCQTTNWDVVLYFHYLMRSENHRERLLHNIIRENTEWQKQIWNAHDMVRDKIDPNPSYFSYGRAITKTHRMLEQLESPNGLPIYIPLLPKDYFPEGHINVKV